MRRILYLRQQYHFGPGKIADYLKRFHRLQIDVKFLERIPGTRKRLYQSRRSMTARGSAS